MERLPGKQPMNAAARWVPRLLTATAVLHVAYAAADQSTWGAVLAGGLWDAVEGDPAREAELWFLVLAPALLALSALARTHARATGRLPASLGLWMIVVGLLISVFVPVSGGWLLLAIGSLTLISARAPGPERAVPPPARGYGRVFDGAQDEHVGVVRRR
jgi:Family of unknown function (DUF6463)